VITCAWFRQRACGWSDPLAKFACSSMTYDPIFVFVVDLCCPTLYFVLAFWMIITFDTLLTLLFCIWLFVDLTIRYWYNINDINYLYEWLKDTARFFLIQLQYLNKLCFIWITKIVYQ
jgi:hypothetical protein